MNHLGIKFYTDATEHLFNPSFSTFFLIKPTKEIIIIYFFAIITLARQSALNNNDMVICQNIYFLIAN